MSVRLKIRNPGGFTLAASGFTLIELLIVIAIIAVIAAMLFPVLGPARQRSRETICASNVRQLYLAMSLYQQDYNGTDPEEGSHPTCESLGTPCTGDSYIYFLKTYTKSRDVRMCPAYPGPGEVPSTSECTYSPSLLIVYPGRNAHEESVDMAAFSKMGPLTPMFACPEYHNPPFHPTMGTSFEAIMSAPVRVLLIRYDGSAKNKTIPRKKAVFPYE